MTQLKWIASKLDRVALALAVVALGLLLFAFVWIRIDLAQFRTGFRSYQFGVMLSLAGLVVSALAVGYGILFKAHRQLAGGLIALVVCLPIYASGMIFRTRVQAVPRIHDITTDTVKPPQFTEETLRRRAGAVNPIEYGGPEIAMQQHKAYPDIKPLTVNLAQPETFDLALKAAQSMGWELVVQDREVGGIEATATTLFFGFKDDVAVRISAGEAPEESRIDVRSISRVGLSDVGANAARIRKYLDRVRKLAGIKE